MNSSHVVSLSLSKQLKDAGYEQVTNFYWVRRHKDWAYQLEYGLPTAMGSESDALVAPLASELMEKLPEFYSVQKVPEGYGWAEEDGNWVVRTKDERVKTYDKNLCNALAKMWLYVFTNVCCGEII